jgi:uridine kinase
MKMLDETELLALEIRRRQARCVAVCGFSGSGKGHLVNLLKQSPYIRVKVLGIDDYYRDDEVLKELFGGDINWDLPEAVDLDRLAEDIAKLKNGKAIRRPDYVHRYSGRGYDPGATEIKLQVDEVLVVEGLFAASPLLEPLMDMIVWVDASAHECLVRRLIRDSRFAGVPIDKVGSPVCKMFADLVETVFPNNIIYSTPTRESDYTIHNSLSFLELRGSGILDLTSCQEFKKLTAGTELFLVDTEKGIHSGGFSIRRATGEVRLFTKEYSEGFFHIMFQCNSLPDFHRMYAFDARS